MAEKHWIDEWMGEVRGLLVEARGKTFRGNFMIGRLALAWDILNEIDEHLADYKVLIDLVAMVWVAKKRGKSYLVGNAIAELDKVVAEFGGKWVEVNC